MMNYLGEEVNNGPELPEEEICAGQLVAVFLLDEDDKPTWHRAVVKHAIFSIKLVKVSQMSISISPSGINPGLEIGTFNCNPRTEVRISAVGKF